MIKARVLIADDHMLVIEGGKAILPDLIEIVGTASDGRSLVEAALRLNPDLIILDISMPLLSGIEAARQIKRSLPKTKFLFLTMHAERLYVQAAYEAGAAGYVLKSAPREELLAAVRQVLAGQLYVSSSLAGDWGHLRDPNQIAKALRLSSREREVIQLIAEGKSGKEIAGLLNISAKTVSFHREKIKRKLGVKSVAELTRHAIAGGFI